MAPFSTRDRSRSPARPKKSSGGFKWKDKPRKSKDETDGDTVSRSYRERSPKYDSRPRDDHADSRDSRDRRRDWSGERERKHKEDKPRRDEDIQRKESRREIERISQPQPAASEVSAPITDRKSVAAKFGAKAAAAVKSSKSDNGSKDTAVDGTPLSSMAAPKYTGLASSEPMIIVHINDRLGTKAAIPCLASDPVRAFKAMVAARIGRQPHEIMIKRQGERPFKDQLTLEDYGVSNGVQLDLELDTGE